MVEWAYAQVPHGPDQHLTIASDTLQHSNDAEKYTYSETYVKIKEMKLNADLSACRVKFDLKADYEAIACGRVYKNGVAIGTEREEAFGTYTTYSEDFADFAKGDLIQIYAMGVFGGRAHVKNMRIYYDFVTTKTAPTNQDP